MDWVLFDVGGWHHYPLSNFPETVLVYPVYQIYRAHVFALAGTFLDFLFFVFLFPTSGIFCLYFLSFFLPNFLSLQNFTKFQFPAAQTTPHSRGRNLKIRL
jgi:hypothetical protein